MRDFSLKYPSTLFTLEGSGEEDVDMWIKYFLNGKMQRCQAKIVFEEFSHRLMT